MFLSHILVLNTFSEAIYMEFDPKMLEQIKNMDPRELEKRIEEISVLIGVDSRMVKQIVGNTDSLVGKLESLDESDLRRMSKKIDKKTLESIRRSMDRGKKDGR